jgi:hypothetical protein
VDSRTQRIHDDHYKDSPPNATPHDCNTTDFIDEIVLFTRKKAPLIGVRTWRDIHEDVKKSIASNIMVSSNLFLVAYTFTKLFKK